MISGVEIKKLNCIPDERGRLMEILRSDDAIFLKFGQAYITTGYPGVVKAWHYHKKQWDNFCVVKGMMKVVLYDNREESPTKGKIMELFMGEFNPLLVRIPPLVYHGFKCISEQEAILINIPTETYKYEDPDEFRVDPHENDIPYSWERSDG
ncbi:MAG: dTDP-4-dehydrorhamnose 3,5-epimerase [Deltaproteobacteria bacterium]|nr:dTDP-4-dehydrorhamnose 3,5-epimerase [Deltaproteobacteria bacterium]